MEITYTLTKEDLWAFRRFHARHKARWRVLTQISNGLLVVLWLAQLLLIIRLAQAWRLVLPLGPRAWVFLLQSHQPLFLNFLLFSLVLAYLFWGWRFLAARQGVEAFQLSQTKHLRIGPDGVEVATAQEHVQRAWRDIPDIGSDRDGVYLYLTSATALVVPRRAFGSVGQSQAFEAQARAFRADPALVAAPGTTAEDSADVWPPRPRVSATEARPLAPAPELEDVPGAIRVSYVTTKADLLRAQWVFLPRQPLALLAIFVPYVLAASVWTFLHLPPAAAVLCAVAVAALGTALTLAWVTHKALTQRFARFPEGRSCQTIARPDLLCDVFPEGRKLYYWLDVSAIQMRNGDVYVLTKGAGGVVVPRSAFPDRAAADAWVSSLRGFWQQARNNGAVQTDPRPNLPQAKN